MRTRLTVGAVLVTLAGCGSQDATPTVPAAATVVQTATASPDPLDFPEGERDGEGVYVVEVTDAAEAQWLCTAMRDVAWPAVYADYDEVRFSFPGPDLTCVPR